MPNLFDYDVLIIGSGAAGLGLALSLASQARIAIVSKDNIPSGSSQNAQGGIAAVIDKTQQNIKSHINDTLTTGCGLCDPKTVHFVVDSSKQAIDWLLHHGVEFTTEAHSQHFHLAQEGGHSQRRILHASDRTGAVIINTLVAKVLSHPNIDCFSQKTVIDLVLQQQQCVGVELLDNVTLNRKFIYAKETVLACGGASGVYQHTTNPDFTSGDGIAMGKRAGCTIRDMEFNQFHPTCFFYEGEKPFLISEALRGEGASLLGPNGKRFMPAYDHRAELAPRDTVARAIYFEMQKQKIDHVYLDISYRPKQFIQSMFPTIYKFCYEQGVDMTQQPIPVVPAAHYTCGGIVTNLQGQTNIPHLSAVGEVACTGLHGANRMASNSLLECFVFASSTGQAIEKNLKAHKYLTITPSTVKQTQTNCPPSSLQQSIASLRKSVWENIGIIRRQKVLQTTTEILETLQKKVETSFHSTALTRAMIEYRNLVTTACLMAAAAAARNHSIGLHYLAD